MWLTGLRAQPYPWNQKDTNEIKQTKKEVRTSTKEETIIQEIDQYIKV